MPGHQHAELSPPIRRDGSRPARAVGGRPVRRPRVRIVDDGPTAAHLAFVTRAAGYLPVASRPDVVLLNLGSRTRVPFKEEGGSPDVPIVALAPLGELSCDFAWLKPARVL